jgi:hypothetical protein
MKKNLLFVAALFISSMLGLQAQNIILVTDNAVTDAPYVTMLEAEGYTVDAVSQKWRDITDLMVTDLNAADLIIFTRQIASSGSYGDAPTPGTLTGRWQSVTTPIIVGADIIVRSSRINLLASNANTDQVDTLMMVKLPLHAVFTNTWLDPADSSTLRVTTEKYQTVQATDAGLGTLLAKDGIHGWVTMAEWAAGSEGYTGAGVQAGKRFYYAGSYSYNLTAAGRRLYLDVVEYMLTGSVTLKPEPSDISITPNSVLEGEAKGTKVGVFSGVDPDGDIASYALVDGDGADNNASFTMDGDTLYTDSVFTYATTQTQSIRVQVTDSAGNTFQKALTITIINTSPTDISLAPSTILEGEAIGTKVGTLSAVDAQDDIASFALVAGEGDTDNASFAIDADTLVTAAVLDFADGATRSIRVQVTDDAANTFEKVLSITVTEKVSSINNKIKNELSIYPNPASDFLIIKDLGTFEGSIYSITGVKVKEFQQNNERLDVSDLVKGMYVISLTSNDKQYTSKFVKE